MLDFADSDTPIEFGEGEAKQPLAKGIKAFLDELPQVVEFGEHATKNRAAGADAGVVEFAAPAGFNVDPEQLARHHRVLAYQKQHNVGYEQALAAVQ
jgi:hypothetical protein